MYRNFRRKLLPFATVLTLWVAISIPLFAVNAESIKVVATVNSKSITNKDIESLLPLNYTRSEYNEMLDLIIEYILVLEHVSKSGVPTISQDQFRDSLLAAMASHGHDNPESYEEFAKDTGVPRYELLELLIKYQFYANALQSLLVSQFAVVSDSEIERFLASELPGFSFDSPTAVLVPEEFNSSVESYGLKNTIPTLMSNNKVRFLSTDDNSGYNTEIKESIAKANADEPVMVTIAGANHYLYKTEKGKDMLSNEMIDLITNGVAAQKSNDLFENYIPALKEAADVRYFP